ncbi:MAG: energy transducer TonB [Sphingomonadales bacterium]|nr:energy transducer TonB [Sphingomonadales bacterium]
MAPPGYVPTNSFPRAAVMRGYGWNIVKAEDFPENALKERREGLARAVLALDKAGAITSCKIETSSGHADLDARTCILLKERAAFEPALDIKGRVTAARISTGIDWRLPPPKSASIEKVVSVPKPLIEQSLPKPEKLVIIMTIDESGKLVGCKREVNSVETAAEREFCERALTRSPRFAPLLDAKGKPVSARVTMRSSIEVSPEPEK